MIVKLQRILFGLSAAVVIVDFVWAMIGKFQIDLLAYAQLGLMSMALLAGGFYYQTKRAEPELAAMLMGASFLCLFSAAASMLNYFFLTLHGPRIDDILVAADRTLGFDWYSTMIAMARYPLLNEVFFRVYNMVLPEIALVMVALAWTGQVEKVYRYCVALGVGALIAIALWALAPSLGAKSLYTLPPEVVSTLTLSVTGDYGKALVALLRDGPGYISPSDLRGLIAFPSYHGVLALIVAWYGWHLRWLRWPLLLLNATVIVSSPIQGGHHMVDLLGSFPVTALALYLATLGETKESSAKLAVMVNKKQKFKIWPVPQGLLARVPYNIKKLPPARLSRH